MCNSVSQNDSDLIKWKTEKTNEIDEIWEYRSLGGWQNCMICSVCREGSTTKCKCAKQKFIKDLTYEQFEELKLDEYKKYMLSYVKKQREKDRLYFENIGKSVD